MNRVRADLDPLIIGSMSISHYVLASYFSCDSCETGHLNAKQHPYQDEIVKNVHQYQLKS